MRRIITVVLLVVFAGGAAAWRLADVKPDPNVQAIADGCQRDTTKIYTGLAPNWVYVNDKDFPVERAAAGAALGRAARSRGRSACSRRASRAPTIRSRTTRTT